ncbi:MAG: hypothetical protein JWL62_3769 [Hyphomicrobiales bacterium]|nr:hypothetical protein [Hyphomicrobiales bacterium]
MGADHCLRGASVWLHQIIQTSCDIKNVLDFKGFLRLSGTPNWYTGPRKSPLYRIAFSVAAVRIG